MSEFTDIFNDFNWHSSYEPQKGVSKKKIIRSLPAKYASSGKFLRAGKDGTFLIHKATSALWKFDETKEKIVPVYQDTILTEEDL